MATWITTSLNTNLWEAYAKNTLAPMIEFYKDENEREDFKFLFWVDKEKDKQIIETKTFNGANVGVLESLNTWDVFIKTFGNDIPFEQRSIKKENIPDGHKFRFNYEPFARKTMSWIATYHNAQEEDLIVWLDADVQMIQRMTSKDLETIVEDSDISFLDRAFPWYSAETGFFTIRKNEQTKAFVDGLLRAYLTGFIFDMSEWHDGYLFKTYLKMAITEKTKIKNLSSKPEEPNVMETSPVARWFIHYKGNLKNHASKSSNNTEQETVVCYNPNDQKVGE